MNILSQYIMALGVLIACEESLGQLYRLFAEQSPELCDFWHKLATEEQAHASWLRNLVSHLRKQTVSFQDNRFQPDNFRTFFTYLQERVNDVRTNTLSNFAALSIAVDCEGTVVEKNFFEVWEGDTPEMRRLLNALTEASKTHLQTVKSMWEQYKPRSISTDRVSGW